MLSVIGNTELNGKWMEKGQTKLGIRRIFMINIDIREEELTFTRESINKIKTALEHGLKEMEASRSIVTSQLTLVTGGICKQHLTKVKDPPHPHPSLFQSCHSLSNSQGSGQEELWVEALQQIRSLGQLAESTLAKSAELESENIFISGGRI